MQKAISNRQIAKNKSQEPNSKIQILRTSETGNQLPLGVGVNQAENEPGLRFPVRVPTTW